MGLLAGSRKLQLPVSAVEDLQALVAAKENAQPRQWAVRHRRQPVTMQAFHRRELDRQRGALASRPGRRPRVAIQSVSLMTARSTMALASERVRQRPGEARRLCARRRRRHQASASAIGDSAVVSWRRSRKRRGGFWRWAVGYEQKWAHGRRGGGGCRCQPWLRWRTRVGVGSGAKATESNRAANSRANLGFPIGAQGRAEHEHGLARLRAAAAQRARRVRRCLRCPSGRRPPPRRRRLRAGWMPAASIASGAASSATAVCKLSVSDSPAARKLAPQDKQCIAGLIRQAGGVVLHCGPIARRRAKAEAARADQQFTAQGNSGNRGGCGRARRVGVGRVMVVGWVFSVQTTAAAKPSTSKNVIAPERKRKVDEYKRGAPRVRVGHKQAIPSLWGDIIATDCIILLPGEAKGRGLGYISKGTAPDGEELLTTIGDILTDEHGQREGRWTHGNHRTQQRRRRATDAATQAAPHERCC